jgi:hypothetical protein
MRRAVLIFAGAISVGCAYGESVGFDVMAGAWAFERYSPGTGVSTRGGPYVTAGFRLPGGAVAYEADFNYRRYNGVKIDASAFGLDNRLPIYFTGEPLRVYAAPHLGFWRFAYGLDAPPAYAETDSDFAFSLGGNLGLRVAAGREGSYVDISYGYQGTKITGPEGFFGSRRILRAKGSIGVSSHVGFGVEAGTVEEGWSFWAADAQVREQLTTYYVGSPYVMIGPYFWF